MRKHLPWLIGALLVGVTLFLGSVLTRGPQMDDPVIFGVNNPDPDPDDENVLPQELSEKMFRKSTVSGSNWKVQSSMRLGQHEAYTRLPEIEDEIHDPYLALGTYERDLDGVTVVAAGIASLRSVAGTADPEVHTAFRSLIKSPRSTGSGPVVASLHTHILGDLEYFACFIFGWTDDPDVAEFTLHFSTGVEVTLDARTHEFFVGLVAKTPRHLDDRERDIEARDRIWGIDISRITAYDAGGNIIDDRRLSMGCNPPTPRNLATASTAVVLTAQQRPR